MGNTLRTCNRRTDSAVTGYFAECHYTVPAAYLYYLRRMGQNDGGLLETECCDLEVDIGTVLELLPGKCEDLEKGLFQFSDH